MQITVQSAKQNLGIQTAPHLHDKMTTSKMMVLVFIALLPAFITNIYFFGFGVLWQFIIAAITAIICEVVVAFLRSRKIIKTLSDYSYLVTALILALTLPPLLPWYLTVVATAFAILLVKHCFGGLGMNIFNPAMAGFIFLMISTPGIFFSTYVSPGPDAYKIATLDTTYQSIFKGADTENLRIKLKEATANADLLTGATYLESIKTVRKAGLTESIAAVDFTNRAFNAYLCMAIAYTIGGLLLIITKVILYQMPLCFIATIFIGGSIWHYLDPAMSISAVEHLLLGGTMLAAFFIITDPVTNAGTSKGRIVFSIFTALLILLIRIQGSYSDSVAFAILLANACAPLIDVLTHRRPFGIGYKDGGLL